jgi:hypothetical protein
MPLSIKPCWRNKPQPSDRARRSSNDSLPGSPLSQTLNENDDPNVNYRLPANFTMARLLRSAGDRQSGSADGAGGVLKERVGL